MRKSILDSVVEDLLSIAPLIRRGIQRKVVRTAFAQIEEDITLPHLEIMKTLKEEGSRHIAEIGERLLIPKPQMTHLIDRLEDLEIVTRQADTADRRIVNLMLTDKGRRIIEELDRVLNESIKVKLSFLTEEELQELSVSLKKLGNILSKL
ncbi:MAG TPA: MarR family transcriptional regulator [Dehalococcoidales bacterium]|nr:MarR family transcriptional regulator [Dehalococcoidales bacterium]